jgi:hypothetical protein
VPDVFRTKWVGSFVGYTAAGTFQGRVGTGFSSVIGRDKTEVVFGVMLLCADGAGGFLFFAEFSVVAVTLAVIAVGG